MGFKESIDREKNSLMSSRRPYETAAFIIFALLMLQQLFFLFKNLFEFIDTKLFFSTANITVVNNLQGFFNRFISIDNSKWSWVIIGVLTLVLYYFLIYIFVWRYCKKRNLAKWTWTTIVVFGPNIFFMPAYVFYVIYVFRDYIFRFIKTVIQEYKDFDPSTLDKEETLILELEEKEAKERASLREEKNKNKVAKKQQKEDIKEEKTDTKDEEVAEN